MKLFLPLLSLAPLALAHHSVWSKRGHAEHAGHLSRSLLDVDVEVSASVGVSAGSSPATNGTTNAAQPKHIDIVVSEGVANPDGGKERMVYLINGDFPPKPLILDQGDDVEIVVTANISEATTVHFHGIDQRGSPWSDGVPGVSQKAIQPGGNFTYRWNAHQTGLYWAHAHRKQQQDDGLYFPIFIRPANDTERPFSKLAAVAGGDATDAAAMARAEANTTIVTINDWRHRPTEEVNALWEEAHIEPLCADSILINGRGSMVCPPMSELQSLASTRGFGNVTAKGCLPLSNEIANPFNGKNEDIPEDMWKTCNATSADRPLYTLEVDPEENGWASFAIVNVGGLWELKFSIDEHPLYVYAVDGQYVDATKSFDTISIPAGTRFQVMVKLDKDAGSSYTIRAAANVVPQMLTGYGILQYKGAKQQNTFAPPAQGYPALPSSKPSMAYDSKPVAADNNLNATSAPEFDPFVDGPPFPAKPPILQGNTTLVVLDMSRHNVTRWAANHTGLPGTLYEDHDPILWPEVYAEVKEAIEYGTGSFAGSLVMDAMSMTILPNDTIVDILIKVPPNHPPHPMHKHFNRYWVLGQGQGDWKFASVAEAIAALPDSFNLVNPAVRDSFNTPVSGESGSWLVVRYRSEIPAASVIHCHISQHLTGGMTEVLLEGVELVHLPPEYAPSQ
ncbi:Cupredoxin [Schizophyllum commune]